MCLLTGSMIKSFSICLTSEGRTTSMSQLQIRADIYSENSQNFGRTSNIQENPIFLSIPDKKMVTLSMKRKSSSNTQLFSEKQKVSRKETSLNPIIRYGSKKSASELLQEIDNVLVADHDSFGHKTSM